jgi:acetoin utilization deacetylase AcuC-like enzyme
LATAISRIRNYDPDVLVVSLGVDSFAGDPVGGFKLQSPDFVDIGKKIRSMNLPTHFIMEGGYAMSALGTNVANVIEGYSA